MTAPEKNQLTKLLKKITYTNPILCISNHFKRKLIIEIKLESFFIILLIDFILAPSSQEEGGVSMGK